MTITENFRVVLTKYIRIAGDVFINRVFKGSDVELKKTYNACIERRLESFL